jgi:hypothetical protein
MNRPGDDLPESPFPTPAELADIAPSRLFVPFESLGNNCEFGMVQRFSGYDPPGLFRNVGFDSAEMMVRALETGFDGMFDEGRYEFTLPHMWPDWRLDCHVHGFGFHTGIPSSIEKPSEAWSRKTRDSIRSFRFMKAKLLEELRIGEKIFVFRFNFDVPPEVMQRFHAALRRHGPGWLLHVTQDPSKPFGWTEKRADGFIVAAIARLMNELPQIIDSEAWRAIARASLAIAGASRHSAPASP